MKKRNFHSGGFVLVEFAIALPLLILIMYGLAIVSLEIFRLGKEQLADYVLETEAQYTMERITDEARAAKEIEIEKITDEIHKIKIVYHAVDDDTGGGNLLDIDPDPYDWTDDYSVYTNKDVWETQIFAPRNVDGIYKTLNAKRQDDDILSNPITGGNYFGDTKINILRYELDAQKKILHIELEMESLLTERKIKIATAVFMPGCETEEGSPHDE